MSSLMYTISHSYRFIREISGYIFHDISGILRALSSVIFSLLLHLQWLFNGFDANSLLKRSWRAGSFGPTAAKR